MATMTEEYEFPCGTKVKMQMSYNPFFDSGHVHFDLKEVVCPLHGKNCKRIK